MGVYDLAACIADIPPLTQQHVLLTFPSDTAACISDIPPPGNAFHHFPVGRSGGGVGFLILKLFKINLHTALSSPALSVYVLTSPLRTSLDMLFLFIASRSSS